MYFILLGALFASGVAADVCLSSLIQGRNNVKERRDLIQRRYYCYQSGNSVYSLQGYR